MALASNHGLSSVRSEHHSRRTSNCIDIRLHIVYQYKFLIGSPTIDTKANGSTAISGETANTDMALGIGANRWHDRVHYRN